MAAGEWFTARVSSCGLFYIAYPSGPENVKAELRTIYSQLCQDDMPMVRRSAASNLGKFAATVEATYLKTDIMSMFEDLTHDGMFSPFDVYSKFLWKILVKGLVSMFCAIGGWDLIFLSLTYLQLSLLVYY